MKYKMKSKKAMSGVVATILMIALVMVITSVVWGIVNNIVKDKIDESESCFAILDKITLNNDYTCYNKNLNQFNFSISFKDIKVDELLVAISSKDNTKTFRLKDNFEDPLLTGRNNIIKLPSANSGKTYTFDTTGFGDITSIEIAPTINSNQCEIVDSILSIRTC